MEPPIIVSSEGDLSFYKTVKDVECSIEGVDVEDGIYQIFDKNSTILNPIARNVRREKSWLFGFDVIDIGKVEIRNGTDKNPEMLKTLLREYIAGQVERKGLIENTFDDNLETLLARAIELGGYT